MFNSKKFAGLKYDKKEEFPLKPQANAYAKSLRKQGYLVEITQNMTGMWLVWARDKEKKTIKDVV